MTAGPRNSRRGCASTPRKNSTTTSMAGFCSTYCGSSPQPARRLERMSLTMYTATVPTCVRALNSLASILEKAAAHAQVRKIDAAVLLGTRLFPDMMPLAMQIHIANDLAQGGAARLAGAPVPAFEAKERNFGE